VRIGDPVPLRALFVLGCLVPALFGQPPSAKTADISLPQILGFEPAADADCPQGWICAPRDTIHLEAASTDSARRIVRMERTYSSGGLISSGRLFSSFAAAIPLGFTGKQIEFLASVKTNDVTGCAALYVREDDDDARAVAFASMQQGRPIKGTKDWTEYSIKLPLDPAAQSFSFGVVLDGIGTAWVRSPRLMLDGKPLDLPARTPRALDHEFDGGSGIRIASLSALQVANLASLGKVWGFLKYFHPDVSAGRYQWDYELFRVLPAVLKAEDRAAANTVLAAWVTRAGIFKKCSSCAANDLRDAAQRPALDWMLDRDLGPIVSRRLGQILDNRPARLKQFYATAQPDLLRGSFESELDYQAVPLPDAGFQLLALYRFWNVIQFWYPYRTMIKPDWESVLYEFIPRIALADSAPAYRQEMALLFAKVHDSNLVLRSPDSAADSCAVSMRLGFIDGQPVAAGSGYGAGNAAGLIPGDILLAIDKEPAGDAIRRLTPFCAASNQAALLREIARHLTDGPCSRPAALRVRRGGEELDVSVDRVSRVGPSGPLADDQPGPAFRQMPDNVAHFKASALQASEVRSHVERASGMAGWIIDLRNRPVLDALFGLARFLLRRSDVFAHFAMPSFDNPGLFTWEPARSPDDDATTPYHGRVVLLVDETTQGPAESAALLLRARAGVEIVGSTTAGAPSDVVPLPLPGGLSGLVTVVGVFSADKKPVQQVGIVPDFVVSPSVARIHEGRDEILEAGLRIVGAAR
jgi:hypothetical protein